MAWLWILIAIVVVAIIVIAAMRARQRRSATLRDRFGPEYDRAVQTHEDRRAAEAELRGREKQRRQFEIKPLPEGTRLTFVNEWRGVQERFVDEPSQAVATADNLVTRVMATRGYPMTEFEEQAGLLSVDHPVVVENYRSAHAVWQRSQTEQVGTEDLREALLRYRSLFDELLRPEGEEPAAAGVSQDGTEPATAGAPEPSGADAAAPAPAASADDRVISERRAGEASEPTDGSAAREAAAPAGETGGPAAGTGGPAAGTGGPAAGTGGRAAAPEAGDGTGQAYEEEPARRGAR
jgi:hypothetical protein